MLVEINWCHSHACCVESSQKKGNAMISLFIDRTQVRIIEQKGIQMMKQMNKTDETNNSNTKKKEA